MDDVDTFVGGLGFPSRKGAVSQTSRMWPVFSCPPPQIVLARCSPPILGGSEQSREMAVSRVPLTGSGKGPGVGHLLTKTESGRQSVAKPSYSTPCRPRPLRWALVEESGEQGQRVLGEDRGKSRN